MSVQPISMDATRTKKVRTDRHARRCCGAAAANADPPVSLPTHALVVSGGGLRVALRPELVPQHFASALRAACLCDARSRLLVRRQLPRPGDERVGIEVVGC